MLQRGVSFICEQVDAGKQVLVVCGAGISRSLTFVLAYLLERGYELRRLTIATRTTPTSAACAGDVNLVYDLPSYIPVGGLLKVLPVYANSEYYRFDCFSFSEKISCYYWNNSC